MSDEPKISQRYRELGREEPPRHVDDAILSAARRAVDSRPAPLVVPTGRRRWYFPLAAAAVIVLAVAVTMHVERERPDAEVVSGNVFKAVPVPSEEAKRSDDAPAKPQPAPQAAPVRKAAPVEGFTPDPKPQARPEPAPAPASPPQGMREEQSAAAADQRLRDQDRLDSQRLELERQKRAREQERAAAQEALASQQMRRQSSGAASRPSAEFARQESARVPAALSTYAERSPEQWLQGIDDLKRQGRHDEAEKQLAEFRKRYPNYRIPEAIAEKFEKR